MKQKPARRAKAEMIADLELRMWHWSLNNGKSAIRNLQSNPPLPDAQVSASLKEK